jgi:hypothetical protein
VQLAAYLAVLTALVLLSRMFSRGRPAARSGLAVSGQPAQRAG